MPWGSTTIAGFALASVLGSSKRSGAPATCYFGLLYNATPETAIDTGLEATIGVGGYARVAITNNDSLWDITANVATNLVEIRWPVATATWDVDPVNQWALFDDPTSLVSSHIWAYGSLNVELSITVAGRVASCPPGSLVITEVA